VIVDRYQLPLGTHSATARDAYVEGADALLGAMPGPLSTLQRALDADPGFALAWVALARASFLEGDVAAARSATARARELAATASPREQSHVHALALAIEGKPAQALAATRSHLAEYPRDALVLAPATGVFGLVGFSGQPGREDELHDWLRSLAPHYGEDWWFDTVYAFAQCETGRLDEARARIERSLVACPANAHGAHVWAHVLYETGELAAAQAFLERWMPLYDRSGLMHCHLSWHVALGALQLGRPRQAWQAYLAAVHPAQGAGSPQGSWGPALNTATDAPSFLWRAQLAGAPAPQAELWTQVHRHALASFPKAGVTFADVHVALACAATGDEANLGRLADELSARLAAGRLPAGEVVLLLVRGLAAYARGDWNAAVADLERALPDTVRIGGSRAQRDVVENTLLAAYVKAGRPADAQRLLAQRVHRRPAVEVAGFSAS
jgi:tetratricopeptide (TPR) repeat protein